MFSKNEFVNFEISGIEKIELCVKFSNSKFSVMVIKVLQHEHIDIGGQVSLLKVNIVSVVADSV